MISEISIRRSLVATGPPRAASTAFCRSGVRAKSSSRSFKDGRATKISSVPVGAPVATSKTAVRTSEIPAFSRATLRVLRYST